MRVRFPLGPRILKSTDAITKADEPTFVGGLRCALVIFTYLLLARPRAARGSPYCSCGHQRHDDEVLASGEQFCEMPVHVKSQERSRSTADLVLPDASPYHLQTLASS
jgi:hypothetical protein